MACPLKSLNSFCTVWHTSGIQQCFSCLGAQIGSAWERGIVIAHCLPPRLQFNHSDALRKFHLQDTKIPIKVGPVGSRREQQKPLGVSEFVEATGENYASNIIVDRARRYLYRRRRLFLGSCALTLF
jgi:hypothetical protein